MKLRTPFLTGAFIALVTMTSYCQVVSVSGDKSTLPVDAYNGWNGNGGSNSPQYGTLTAGFDLIIQNLSVSLTSISRTAAQNNYNGWGNTGLSDIDMGFVLHSPNGESCTLLPTGWLYYGDCPTTLSNIEIINTNQSQSLVKSTMPVYTGSMNQLGWSCYQGYALRSVNSFPTDWTAGTMNARGTWQLEVDVNDANSSEGGEWNTSCPYGNQTWTYWGQPTHVTVNKWALNFTGSFAVALFPNVNLFTTTIQRLATTTSQTFTVTNTGSYQLVISGVSNWQGATQDYQIDPSVTFPIIIPAPTPSNPSPSATITVDFTPTNVGARLAQFNVVSNGLNTTTVPATAQSQTIFLFGTGAAPLMTSNNAPSFFLQTPELVRLDTIRYLHITNPGNQPLTIGQYLPDGQTHINGTNGVTITNFIDPDSNLTTGAGDYTIIYPPSLMPGKPQYTGTYTIPKGGTDSIGIMFKPLGEGPRIALMNVYSNAVTITTTQGIHSVDSIGIILEGKGLAPHLAISFTNFGTVAEGSLDTTNICVTDTGTGEAIFLEQALISGFTNRYKIVTPLPKIIKADSTACMQVVFMPDTTTGYESARLQLLTNAVTSDSNVVLTLQGISSPTARAVFTPSSLFTNAKEQSCGPPQAGMIVVTNSGATPLVIDGISFTGTGAANYKLSPKLLLPLTVPGPAPETLAVLFAPPAGHGGASMASAVILSNNIGGGRDEITLGGTVEEEDAIIAKDSLFAGTVLDVNAAKTLPDTLRNPGTFAVTIISQQFLGQDTGVYTLTPFTPTTIPAGGMAVGAVQFKPNGASYIIQPTVAALQVKTSSACDSVITIPLLARSCPAGVLPNVDTATVLFQGQQVALTKQTSDTISVQNIGCDSLTITSAVITGPDAAEYNNAVVVYPKTSFAPSATVPVVVTFAPKTLGTKSATLTITTSAGTSYSYALQGVGVTTSAVAEPGAAMYVTQLGQNYPNPFRPTTTIEYEVGAGGMVQLDVLNPLGERVAVLVAGEQPPGKYSAVFDASALPEGVYYYRLRTESMTATRMMTLLR